MAKITKRFVDGLRGGDRRVTFWDDDLKGFGVRVEPRRETRPDLRTFVIRYRAGGGGRGAPERLVVLGRYGDAFTVERARTEAGKLLAEVRLGRDPAGEKASRRAAPTLAEIAERFMTEEIRPTRKPRSVELYEMLLRVHVLPKLGTRKAADLTQSDFRKLHRAIGETKRVTANRAITLVSGLYSWAQDAGEVPKGVNPAKGIKKFPEQNKERFLSEEEMQRLGDVLREAETVGLPYSIDETKPGAKHAPKEENRRVVVSPLATAAIRLLLLTGLRLREVLNLKWADVDFDRGELLLPDSKTGRRRVLINAPTLEVLSGLPRLGSIVVPGDDPDRPRHDLQRPWAAIAKRAGLEGVRIHDLRHSHASIGAGAGFGLPVLGRLLGHRQAATTARYAHLADDPLRRASNAIASTIAAALDGRPAADVVELRKARTK